MNETRRKPDPSIGAVVVLAIGFLPAIGFLAQDNLAVGLAFGVLAYGMFGLLVALGHVQGRRRRTLRELVGCSDDG